MLRNNHFCWILPYHLLLILILIGIEAAEVDRKEDFYIVFLKDHPVVNDESAFRRHINVLSSLKGRDATESHVYSYTKIFNAFAAKLSQQEVRKLSGMDEVASVIPSRYRRLHTTRSWEFIGLPATAKRRLKGESNIIVGVFDTGITPQSKSFNDDGLGPPPAKWKGSCHHFANFTGCNNKLIGARYFKLDKVPDPNDIMSPIDVHGHGTHTSSTLAGSLVPDASLFGLARGTARGAVPSARVAMYKVCWATSVGGLTGSYTTDVISVGAFHAMRKGILTVASAGNDGPNLNTVANHAPWVLTVAASGIDRQFRSNVQLGSGRIVSGIGVSAFDPKQKLYPLALGVDIAKSADTRESSRYCTEGSMDSKKVKGQLVYCQLGSWGADSAIKELGGVGTIIESDQFLDSASIFMAPATIVNSSIGKSINNYIHSERLPSAVIYKSREVKIKAPFIASFSSRGPNPGTKRLLKPDIAAPGIDILASYTPLKSLTGLKGDTQYSEFTLMSGTSMSCPHVGGAAAYVKSFHSDWSPSAIKSALMTTARPMSSKVDREGEFAYGAGQVNPTRARSPGLIYDMDDMSYIQFLCHEGYNSSSVSSLLRQRVNCSTLIPANGEDAINYPTMQLGIKSDQEPTVGVFRRRITNVGQAKSVYNATIRAPKGVDITVKPMTLSFTRVMQKRSFKVVVKAKPMSNAIILSGSLIWKSSRHIVRSPIVIYDPKVFD
ncbi:subtilisin-like protease SBT4.14 isoform X2 [Lycium ferocissimum]|uniref:subtilisin-like protease SBT4.14 isoform X2 n=1 Tax=Lycium ferocissimum TaxID=112874 RepID=UPI002814BF6F|nr:subtilisin-like protease SBT4.14 isoform X2 [Lycium ferocissimum]